MLWALLQPESKVFRRDEKGDDIGKSTYSGSEEARAKLWEHTEKEVEEAASTAT